MIPDYSQLLRELREMPADAAPKAKPEMRKARPAVLLTRAKPATVALVFKSFDAPASSLKDIIAEKKQKLAELANLATQMAERGELTADQASLIDAEIGLHADAIARLETCQE